MQFDLIITNGYIVDGSGRNKFVSDIGVVGKKISAIGNLANATAKNMIDATGMIVSPGFIDVHAHADGALLIDGQHASGIRQGITTEIIAPDGLTLAPLSKNNYAMYRWYLSGILGLPPDDLDMSSIEAARSNYHKKTSCNVAMFAGHGPIRLETVGFKDIPLVGQDMNNAKNLLRESIEQGACGFSTGLSYYPNSYSDTKELIELCKVVAEFDLPLSIHLRNHNTDRGYGGGGVVEAIEIGKRSGAKIHFEHYRTQPGSEGEVASILKPIDAGKSEGVDITLEAYPYPVGSSFPQSFFPGWVHENGPEEMLARLKNPSEKARMLADVKDKLGERGSSNVWTWINSTANSKLPGLLFDDVANKRGTSLENMICDVMAEENLACGFRGAPPHSISVTRQIEADVMELLSRDDYMIGSDAIPIGQLPHPRAYGCFPRVVGRLRRRLGYPIEQVIQRITQNPAQRFGLKSRGVLLEDKYADIVIFDGERIIDRSSFEDPKLHPEGIHFVIVNGKLAVDKEQVTGTLAGEAIP